MDQKRAEIDTVVFDVGNVLVRFEPDKQLARLYPPEVAQMLYQGIFQTPLWREIDRGVDSIEAVIGQILAQAPAVAPYVEEIVYQQYPAWLELKEDTISYLPRLRAVGYRLYILSNFNAQFFQQQAPSFPFLSWMDGMVISGAEKALKPDPEIYNILLKRYGIDASRAVFYDDVAENIEGAKAVGMGGVVFHSAQQLEPLLKLELPLA